MKQKAIMMIVLICTVAQGVWAQDVDENYSKSYVVCSWDETTKSVKKNVEHFNAVGRYTETNPDQWITLEHNFVQHWVFEGTLTCKVIQVPAGEEHHIILLDGTTLTVDHIKLEADAKLHIHTQQGLNGNTGTLNVKNNSYEGAAGIGGGNGSSAGDLIIHGGTISVKNYQDYGAGIGGGKGGNGGKVTVYDGTIDVKAYGNGGSAIGGGKNGNGGDVKIYGGELTLEGGYTGSSSDGTFDITIGRGEGGSSDGSLTLGNVQVYRGIKGSGFVKYDETPSNGQLRNIWCQSANPVKLKPCDSHHFVAAICNKCGFESETEPKSITYLDRTWDSENKKIVEKEVTVYGAQNLADFIKTAEPSRFNAGNATFYVTGKIDMPDCTWTTYQNTNLIICDDADVSLGHVVYQGHFDIFHIYGQKNDTGKLTVNANKKPAHRNSEGDVAFEVGLGTSYAGSEHLNLHGGTITAYGTADHPGIGAGSYVQNYEVGDIWIYGGKIYAEGGEDGGNGIGGWIHRVHIFGGDITAVAHGNVPGIGGDMDDLDFRPVPSKLIEIYGGDVHAFGGEDASGIGASKGCNSGPIRIYGGTVYAEGKGWAAGIGAGRDGDAGSIIITGGDVTGRGGKYAAGIGGGINGRGGTINISGGTVRGYGGVDAAGIGGGEDGDSGDITISGGTVYAWATGDDSNAAGIGAGEDGNGNNIIITGGTVYASGGSGDGPAIGSNLSGDSKGTLTIGDNLMVEAGSAQSNIERRFTSLERVNACLYRKYAEIAVCQHNTPTRGSDLTAARSYTIVENGHEVHCRYCNEVTTDSHHFTNDVCDECGKTFNADDDMWTITIYQANTSKDIAYEANYDGGTQYKVLKGKEFSIPQLTKDVEGLSLKALVKDPTTAPSIIWLTDDEMKTPTNLFDPSQTFIPEADAKIYARYRLDFTTNWQWQEDDYGFINPEKVELYISNPLLYDGNEQSIVTNNIQVQENPTEDDITYTATVTYPYQYPDGLTGVTYTFTDVKHSPYFSKAITLYDNEKNNNTIYKYNGKTVEVTLSDHTFYHDGCWNTICLPFALTAEQLAKEDCPLHGATIKRLVDCSLYGGTLTLSFSDDLDATEAGRAYIVKWPQDGADVSSPVFKDVTVSEDIHMEPILKNRNGEEQTGDGENQYGVLFWGKYDPFQFTDSYVERKQVLYMGASNKLYYPSVPMTIGAFRAFFLLYGFSVGDLNANSKSVVLDFGEEDVDGIVSLTPNFSPMGEGSAYYTLDGRRLNGKPTQRGIYIMNGRKVIIK